MKNDPKPSKKQPKAKYTSYHIRVGTELHTRLSKHFKTLKNIDAEHNTIQKWANEAVKERLKLQKDLSPEKLPKDHNYNLRIETDLVEKIENNVKVSKKYCRGYSKKQWFIEALSDKLSREENLAKKQLKKMINASQSNVFSSNTDN